MSDNNEQGRGLKVELSGGLFVCGGGGGEKWQGRDWEPKDMGA